MIKDHIKQFNKNLKVASEETKNKHKATAEEWYETYGTLYEEDTTPGGWPTSYVVIKSLFHPKEPMDSEVRSANSNGSNATGAVEASRRTTEDAVSDDIFNI